jgi:uncharacterized protein YrzB (UPF0473 family)
MDNKEDFEFEGDFLPDIITLTDEEGEEHVFELVDTLEKGEDTYVALMTCTENPEDMLDEDLNLVIMKIIEEDGEEILEAIEDDDEFDEISEIFIDRLSDLYEFEENMDIE